MNKIIPERVDIILEPGQGYSGAPKFVAQKDQEYYESTILKVGQPAQGKSNNTEPAFAKVPTKTNFSPANTPSISP